MGPLLFGSKCLRDEVWTSGFSLYDLQVICHQRKAITSGFGRRPMGMKRRVVVLAAGMFCGAVLPACSDTGGENVLLPARIYEVTKPFTDDDGGVAVNVSGLACMRTDAAQSTCLVIDDQGRFAQIASIGNGTVAAGARLALIGRKPSKDTVGRPPIQPGCSGSNRKFKDLDGEAVAYTPPFFYVAGSHGCSRHGNKFRSSAFILARIPEGQIADASSDGTLSLDSSNVETTYRLSEALVGAPQTRQYFTQDLMSANGLNVEGLAVTGGKLFAGLRAPTLDGKAFIVAVDAGKLFDGSAVINQGDVHTISVKLGFDRGIRDLARLNEEQLLILSGPAQDARVPFEIHVLDIMAETSTLLGTLGELPDAKGAKAEAISVLSQHGNAIDVLVMFDGLKSGGPREYSIILK
jgi:hypothetical protein